MCVSPGVFTPCQVVELYQSSTVCSCKVGELIFIEVRRAFPDERALIIV